MLKRFKLMLLSAISFGIFASPKILSNSSATFACDSINCIDENQNKERLKSMKEAEPKSESKKEAEMKTFLLITLIGVPVAVGGASGFFFFKKYTSKKKHGNQEPDNR